MARSPASAAAPADEEKLEKGWPPSNSSSALVSRAGSAEAPAPPLPAGPKPVKSTPTCAACSRGVVGATAHIVTAVVGSGVLALPYSTAVLGWVAGPLLILACSALTLFTSLLLVECYVAKGKLHRTYSGAVESMFGRWGFHTCVWVQHVSLVLYAIAFTVTGAQSCQTVAQSICAEQSVTSGCFDSFWQWALIFGGIQLVLGQLKSLHQFWWASVLGALCSVSYSATVVGMTAGNLDGAYGHGSAGGLAFTGTGTKVWSLLNGLGSILFSFNISLILLEVQDTLRHPGAMPTCALAVDAVAHAPMRLMRHAVWISVCLMTGLYLLVACFGYAALGDATPYNILTGPWGEGWQPSRVPPWVVQMANVMVFVRTVPAYQVYSIPFLIFVEERLELASRWPSWLTGWRLRLVWRSPYVALITLVSILMPFFQIVCGFIGAFCFWPIVVHFPLEMYIKKARPRGARLYALRTLNAAGLLVTLACTVGSVHLLVTSWSDFSLFSSNTQTTTALT